MIRNDEWITIKIDYYTDLETGIKMYDFEEMEAQFVEHMMELRNDMDEQIDAWNEKQLDYAMDSMTNDE